MKHITAFNAPLSYSPADGLSIDTVLKKYPALAPFYQELGHTEMVEVPSAPNGATILAKLEWQNPEGSVKDRVAFALLCDVLGRQQHQSLDQLRILEYSGGNLSASLSRLCHDLGIQARFVLSSGAPSSLLRLLDDRQALYDLVDKEKGFYGVVQEAIRIAEKEPDWTFLYQHRNQVNVQFHEQTTGGEILEQLGGLEPAAWVSSIGTGGSLIGVAKALAKHFPALKVVGVTPAELPYGSEQPPNGLPKYAGSGGMGNGICQPFVKSYPGSIDHRSISLPEAFKGMVEFKRKTGIKIGSSAAANWLVAYSLSTQLPRDAVIVTMFPDAGSPEEWSRATS